VNSQAGTRERSTTKYALVAASVRAQVEDGTLRPGALVPSGAALARETGYSVLTCRRALRILIQDGVLVSGASPGARPRVPQRDPAPGGRDLTDAARALSAALAAWRHAAGLTQPQLAELIGMSVTTVGHAETGRVWHSRHFWELADEGVGAGGELLALHDAYRAAAVSAGACAVDEEAAMEGAADSHETADVTADDADAETIALAVPDRVKCVTITWADGSVTPVCPPSDNNCSSGGNQQ
jgi:DNA-binding transcriptional regulator YhcF (GntR family)